ncbi:hypothetical protein DFR42_11221 [Undibacterium pigrum]|uniref:Uncharacterized protein n=2 Tax=Undibacterium pigrum TaxID=401470 RepID=A0A318ISN2_9BURK|nr:hypothetical protein DFR42_11221 [Undibacterium pigrum]
MKFFYLLLAALWVSSSHAADQQLSCQKAMLYPEVEHELIQQHPAKVSRVDAHTLEVKHAKGVERFIDQPPHEALAGTHWFYCGYSATQKVHLIGHNVDSLFSGIILRHSDGKTFKAGHTILMSPKGKKFLAIEQQSGLDGEDWTVYKLYGKKLWQGYAGILSTPVKNEPVMVMAQFVNPVWRDEDVLEADISCADIIKGKATLAISNIGKAAPRWSSKPNC